MLFRSHKPAGYVSATEDRYDRTVMELIPEMENSYTNAYGNHATAPSDRCGIDCKATDCMYNEQCKCEAGKVSVEGSCACHKDGTECATFQCR